MPIPDNLSVRRLRERLKNTRLPEDQFRFPKALRDAGYHTVLSGKNHMGDVSGAFETISRGKGPGKSEDWVDLLSRPLDSTG